MIKRKTILNRDHDAEEELETIREDDLYYSTRQIELNVMAREACDRLLDIEKRARERNNCDVVVVHYSRVYAAREETHDEAKARVEKARKAAETRRVNDLKKQEKALKGREYERYLTLKQKYEPIEKALEQRASQE